MQDYYIGKRLAENRAALEQYSQGILLKLQGNPGANPLIPADPLPGITAAKITLLGDLLHLYTDAQTAQTGEQSDATDERTARDNLISDITHQRITIQYAADAEWPYTDDNNAGVRREFGLPLSRPFNG